ncbi:type I polyketide synthase domain protein [Mycobacteroides abscessus 1948]|uniref:Type I polyketide synthase domain protein n=1 Tax=Mycobacteroides abscessus 1948 TaxID=1299323 RepID=A0A829QQE0_9MYCO|nr:type I polyketide synthase domain protein [Mycobacteroides abscessus 1948]
MNCYQRRTARSVDGNGGTLQSQAVADPAGPRRRWRCRWPYRPRSQGTSVRRTPSPGNHEWPGRRIRRY